MLIVHTVHFRMPKSLELQFAAVAAMQAYVNSHEQRAAAGDVVGFKCVRCGKKRMQSDKCTECGETQTKPIASYVLRYSHDMSVRDWSVFTALGLELNLLSCDEPQDEEMVVDFTDKKIAKFERSGKHLAQICGVMLGVLPPALPVISTVVPKTDEPWRWWLDEYGITLDHIVRVTDNQITGVCGYASEITYAAAARGLPVVEILPKGRPRNWMSKNQNIMYRMVREVDDRLELLRLCRRAQLSIEMEIMQRQQMAVQV